MPALPFMAASRAAVGRTAVGPKATGVPGPKKKETPYVDLLMGGTSQDVSSDVSSRIAGNFPVVLPPTPVQTPPSRADVDVVTMADPSVTQMIKQGILPPSVVSTPPGTSTGTAGTPAPSPSTGGTTTPPTSRGAPTPDTFTAPPSGAGAGELSSAGVIQRGTQAAVASIDSAISEVRRILNQSVFDAKMAAIAQQFINGLSEALKSISDELAGWYAKMGGPQDLGLQQAIQVLREEIEFQKRQLEESLNARGMLQSGVMAQAEALIRRGGLDQAQQLVANRLAELQGVILQSISSLAQTRMQGLSNIYQQGLQSLTSLASAREGTRSQALSTLGGLMGARAQALQGGAIEQVGAAQRDLQLQQQQWLNEQQLALQRAQQEAQANLWGAQADRYRAETNLLLNPPTQGYTSVDFGSEVANTLSRIHAGTFTQQDYEVTLNNLRMYDPEAAVYYEYIVQEHLKALRKTLPQATPATGLVVPRPSPMLPDPTKYNQK